MDLSEWIKSNILPLLVIVGSFVGVYSTLQSNIHTLNAEYSELHSHVRKLDREVTKIPVLEKEIVTLKEDLGEFKPVIADLAKGVHGLNVTLARLEGKLEAGNFSDK